MSSPKIVWLQTAVALFFLSVVSAVRAEALLVPQGQALSVELDRVANTIAVGDIEIAQARVAFDNTIVLMGREVGTTNIIVYDDDGFEIYNSPITVTASLFNRNVSIIGSGQRRSLICGPGRCDEPRQPDQIIHSETTVENEAAFSERTVQSTRQTY